MELKDIKSGVATILIYVLVQCTRTMYVQTQVYFKQFLLSITLLGTVLIVQ